MATLGISYVLQDIEGKFYRIPMHYNEDDVDTVEKANNIVQVIGDKLKGISDCRVRRAEVTFPIVIGADDDAVTNAARGDAGATLSFNNASGRAYSLYIPGFNHELMLNGLVVATDPLVSGFTSSVMAGTGITGNYQATDQHEIDLVSFNRGIQSTRKTRR